MKTNKQIEAIKELDESAERQLTGYQLEQYYKYRDNWLDEVEEALTGLIWSFLEEESDNE